MPRVLLRLEFDGAGHCGWQTQGHELPEPRGQAHNLTSLQSEVERALLALLVKTHNRIVVVGCGRTDAGVHADEYFCHFDCMLDTSGDITLDRLEKIRHGLNAHLPQSIGVTAAYKVPNDFSAVDSVTSKIYEYRVLVRRAKPVLELGRCHWLPLKAEDLDFDALSLAMNVIEGEHDFRAFMAAHSDVKTTVRRLLSARLVRQSLGDDVQGERLRFRFHGEGFLKHMVRNLSGTLIEVATGKRTVKSVEDLLAPAARTEAGYCAPAAGLRLMQVFYGKRELDGFEKVPL